MDYLLDACALIALFNEEAGADKVSELLTNAETGTDRLFITSIQTLEVFYDRIYIKGKEYADAVLENIYTSKINILSEIPREVVQDAGKFKTTYSMSLGDTILAATARYINATIVSCDHKELEVIEKHEHIPFLWIRPQL
jgi:predicted nucleic acid-binding protein